MDIVHDSYLVWFNKTGNDLFDEDRALISTVIRNVVMTYNQKSRFMYDGVKYKRKFYSQNEYENNSSEEVRTLFFRIPVELTCQITPEDILIGKDLKEQFDKKISGKFEPYYNLLVKGYKGTEIIEELNASQSLVSWYIHQIRNKLILN